MQYGIKEGVISESFPKRRYSFSAFKLLSPVYISTIYLLFCCCHYCIDLNVKHSFSVMKHVYNVVASFDLVLKL